MSTATRVIKNTGYLYAKMGITMFISLYTTRLILNSLGASDFGIFNIVGGAIAMLGFLNAAMAGATQRFMSYSEGEGNKEKQKSIFNVSLVLHFGIAFAVGIALVIAGYFFFNGILNIPEERTFAAQVVYGSLIVSTMFTVMTVPYDAAMNAHENMKYYAIIGIFESLLKLAVAFACVYTTHDKLIVYGSLMACIPLITLTIMRVYCHRHYEECTIRIKKYWDKGLMREMTGFAGWNFFVTAITMILNYSSGIVLNIFWGTKLNAAQGIANQINGQIQAFSTNMQKAIAPIIVKKEGEGNREKMINVAILGGKINFYINMMLMFPVILSAPTILKIWLKNVPEYATLFTQLSFIIALLECFLNSLSQIISAEGRIKFPSIVRSIHNIIYIPLTIILFHLHYPAYTLYILLIIKTLISISITLYFTKKYCNMSVRFYTINVITRCILASLIVLAALSAISSKTIIGLITLFACSGIFSSIVFFYIISTQSEQKIFKITILTIINRIIKR